MAESPFPLWRPVDPTAPPTDEFDEGPLTDRAVLPAPQAEVMAVYRRLAMPRIIAAGMTTVTIRAAILPAEADRLPLWVIAEFLADERPPEDGRETQEEFDERVRQDQARRLAEATPEQKADAAERAEAIRRLAEGNEPPL